jgi:hypothetical protein
MRTVVFDISLSLGGIHDGVEPSAGGARGTGGGRGC